MTLAQRFAADPRVRVLPAAEGGRCVAFDDGFHHFEECRFPDGSVASKVDEREWLPVPIPPPGEDAEWDTGPAPRFAALQLAPLCRRAVRVVHGMFVCRRGEPLGRRRARWRREALRLAALATASITLNTQIDECRETYQATGDAACLVRLSIIRVVLRQRIAQIRPEDAPHDPR